MDKRDLKQIGDLIDVKLKKGLNGFEDKFDKKIDLKIEKRFDEFEEKLFKWKSEIFNLVDGLAIEIRDNREFRDIGGHQIANNSRRIEKLEKKVFPI